MCLVIAAKGKMFCMYVERICLIELIDPLEETNKQSNYSSKSLDINFHSFTSTFNPQTICIEGVVVQKMELEVLALSEFRVFNVSGDFLVCKGVCQSIEISIQNTVISKVLLN